MNEIIEFAEKKKLERDRVAKKTKICKTIIEWTIGIFFVMAGMCAAEKISELVMYAYIFIGTIVVAQSAIVLAVQEMKLAKYYDENEYNYDEDEE